MTFHFRTILAAMLAALLPATLASATLVNLDVQSHSTADANNPASTVWIDPAPDGVPALQNINDQWNYHSSTSAGSTTALSDVNGGATGITFTLLNNVGDGIRNNTSLGGSAPFDDVARDEFHASGSDGVMLELSGLDASGATTYDLYVIAAHLYSGGWTDIDVTHGGGSETKQLTNPLNGGNSPHYTGGTISLGGQYQEFIGITADNLGKIAFNVSDFGGGSGERYFSGLQLEVHAVPEPTSLLMFACMGLVSLATRRPC